MRENFKKWKWRFFLALTAHPETALRQFVVGGKGVKIILAKFHYMLLKRSGRVSLIDTHFPDWADSVLAFNLG